MTDPEDRLFDTGTDDVPLKNMTTAEMKAFSKKAKLIMKNRKLIQKPANLTEKMARFATPTDADLSRFDDTLKKTVQ